MGKARPASSAADTILHRACFTILLRRIFGWKRQYSRGKSNNEPTEEAALKDRIEQLEKLVGRLTLENEFIKKGL